MDVTNAKMPTYVVDHVGIGRIPKYSPEDLNVGAMDQRIRDLEKRCVTLDATLTMKTSHYDALEDDFNIVKLAVEQHTTRLRAIKHPSKGAKKMHHSHSVMPVQSHLLSPPVLSSTLTKHAEAPSVPVRSEHGKETEAIVDFNPPSTSTSTVTAATTKTSAVSPERSIAEAVFKSFLITVEAKDYDTFMNSDVWLSGTRLRIQGFKDSRIQGFKEHLFVNTNM